MANEEGQQDHQGRDEEKKVPSSEPSIAHNVAHDAATAPAESKAAAAEGSLPDAAPNTQAEPVAAKSITPEPAAPELVEKIDEPAQVRAAYEHPLPIRITHWVNAISLFVMITSGLRIFRAFPSFGPKIPQKVLLDIPKSLTLGGWLGGALQWHFTFMWFFAAGGAFYVAYQIISRHYRTMLVMPRDIPGVW